MNPAPRRRTHAPDATKQHGDWLSLVEISGPFLSMPVLRGTWPSLDALDDRPGLRSAHADWTANPMTGQRPWIEFVLGDLLGWRHGTERALHWQDDSGLDTLAMDVDEHDLRVVPDFALAAPGEDPKPATAEVLGLVCPPGSHPTARRAGDTWAATPADRLAKLCRRHEVELGLATDGRWWTLVWAPRDAVTTIATFDAASWPEHAEQYVLRAFLSLLRRERFFTVPDDEKLVALLHGSKDRQEEITEALGDNVRRAVELLVAAIGRADTAARDRGDDDLADVAAHEVYRGAVSVMMRIVFVLFAEERGLLPADNELYAGSYSAGRLCALLEQLARDGSEDDLEHSSEHWNRLLALFQAVHAGIDHPALIMHPHDGSLFDPERFGWLPATIDDRTVLHMLRAVQYVQIGTGRNAEPRKLSFRELDVEQIGYVYEGLLAYDGYRADDVVLGLIGKAGLEKELGLRELEQLAADCADTPELAATLAERYKDHKIGTATALGKALRPHTGLDHEDARRKLLAATDGDVALADRLQAFSGILRQDLRGLPMVIMPGQLYVTDSPLRRNTGTHYTPRALAEEVVEGALEPLVYEPGPLQTADRSIWKAKSSNEILALNVADIAMGSAAFLVAAARYLGQHLLEAWTREGNERVQHRAVTDGGDDDPALVDARREIIEHCLYGVDINDMAVEMAKLSLWLVSMDPTRPFTFLDDRLVAGDSLLGIASLDQLEYMHLDPEAGRTLHDESLFGSTPARALLAEAAAQRRAIAEVDGSTLDGLARKRAMLAESTERTQHLRLLADLTVGAALAHSGRGGGGFDSGSVDAADHAPGPAHTEQDAEDQAWEWLATDLPHGSFPREPLHWPLALPEVFDRGGFDAVIGNPPFLGGQKLTGALGTAYREYLVNGIGHGVRGSADLIAYFALRAHHVLNEHGQTGLIATNTLAQGDTREVGLDQVVASGTTIRCSTKSKRWPSKSVALEYCAIWTSDAPLAALAERRADSMIVPGITTSLDPQSRVTGQPRRLARNQGISFIGSYVLGLGFTMEPERAQELISKDQRNRDVLFPYLIGQDINSSPTATASRWIINFHDWPEERAQKYPECYDQVRCDVKPEREKNSRKARRERWWRYAERTPELIESIDGLQRVVVLTLVSKTMMPMMVSTGQIFAHKLAVFATEDMAMLALLSSAPHYWWTARRTSTMKTDINYSPSDVLETFAMPQLSGELRQLGEELDGYRQDMMVARNAGLTKTYNLVFDADCHDDDIEELRRIHREVDVATVRAYGWEERIAGVGGLDHGFYKVGREIRYTIGPAAQREVLDSLLELNHELYAEEVAQGLHEKKKKRTSTDEGTLF